LSALATYYTLKNDTSKVEKYLLKKRETIFEIYDQSSEQFGYYLAEHAAHFYRVHEFERSAEYFDKTLDILKNYNSADYYNVLLSSSFADFQNGEIGKARRKVLSSKKSLVDQINRQFVFFSGEEKVKYMNFVNNKFKFINTILCNYNSYPKVSEIYDNVLITKELSLHSDLDFEF